MKIEFRKLPSVKKNFSTSLLSVKFEGTFCKISSTLAKFETTLRGTIECECCRCSETGDLKLDESFNFLVSDRVHKNEESEDLIIELNNDIIDFDEIIQSEVASFQSEYYLCDTCKENSEDFEKEF